MGMIYHLPLIIGLDVVQSSKISMERWWSRRSSPGRGRDEISFGILNGRQTCKKTAYRCSRALLLYEIVTDHADLNTSRTCLLRIINLWMFIQHLWPRSTACAYYSSDMLVVVSTCCVFAIDSDFMLAGMMPARTVSFPAKTVGAVRMDEAAAFCRTFWLRTSN